MKYIYLLVLILPLYITSCTKEQKYQVNQKDLDSSCKYDTDCKKELYCNTEFNVCSKLNVTTLQQCVFNSDCYNQKNESLCLDKTKPCKCNQGKCKTYDPCTNNPCLALKNENKTKCSEIDTKPFYNCSCSDNYILKDNKCKYNCNEYGILNSDNNGCDCQTKYKFTNGNCNFDCTNILNSHPNNNNNACDCDFNYKLVSNSCIFDCSVIPNSHPNEENNDCICNEGYITSSNFCCQKNSTYDTQTETCKCNANFHLENNKCVKDTICTNNPCTKENEVCIEDSNETNGYRCECSDNYHRTGNICCKQFYSSNNLSDNSEACVSDYKLCTSNIDCTNGEICTINKEQDKIITYCKPKISNAKKASLYCNKDSDCESNTCIKYADDDNDETNGFDGYCARICIKSTQSAPCDNLDCGNGGTCSINPIFNIPECICPVGYKSIGKKCEQISIAQGNICGVSPELVINSSGIYETSNKTSDGYTNNYQGSCGNSSNNDTVFKLDLSKDSLVVIQTLTEIDTLIYLKETCLGEDIACNDDIVPSTIMRSKIIKHLNKGIYYLFIDSMNGESDLNKTIRFAVKLIGDDKCPIGSNCTDKNITKSGTNKIIPICEPKSKNGELITKCYKENDCKNGKTCSYNPFDSNSTLNNTLGCILAENNCTPSYEENYTNGGFCCSNYSLDIDNLEICSTFCENSIDCSVEYNCKSFTVKDPISGEVKYNSDLDSTKTCIAKNNYCKNDIECTSQSKPFCTLRDNNDGRLYSLCSNRNGFTKNIGANCSFAGYNNCYNYACLIEGQGININNNSASYCTAPCKYNSNCPSGYKCKEATLIYPENNDITKTCKRTVDDGCISYNLKACVKDNN